MTKMQAKKWAQKRNWYKRRLKAAAALKNNEVLTPIEQNILRDINSLFVILLDNWDSRNEESKEMYLM